MNYNLSKTRIIKVRRLEDDGTNLVKSAERTRGQVVTAIGKGLTYVTAIYKNGKWCKGDNVIQYSVDDEHFIRTDGNRTKADNLGELPEF